MQCFLETALAEAACLSLSWFS